MSLSNVRTQMYSVSSEHLVQPLTSLWIKISCSLSSYSLIPQPRVSSHLQSRSRESKCEDENRSSLSSLEFAILCQAESAEDAHMLCNVFGSSSMSVKVL